MNNVDSVSEMICLAYRDDFSKKTPSEQMIIRTWAKSILQYLNIKDA